MNYYHYYYYYSKKRKRKEFFIIVYCSKINGIDLKIARSLNIVCMGGYIAMFIIIPCNFCYNDGPIQAYQ